MMLDVPTDDQNRPLVDIIDTGLHPGLDDPNATLDELLEHAANHAAQWARHGGITFSQRYLDASTDVEWGWPNLTGGLYGPSLVPSDPCENEYEQEAGLEDAAIDCD